MTRKTSRRRFLKATAAVGAAAGLNVAVLAQDGGDENTILLGGLTEGWQPYRLPGEDAGEADQNPTLTLEAGATYTLAWKNVDGQPHNVAFQDSEGENLQVLEVIELDSEGFEELNQTDADGTATPENETDGNETDGETTVGGEDLVDVTENVSEEGAIQAVRFTATEEMTTYICTVHPTTMVGDVEIEGGDGEDGGENESG
ncbi:plastocyanin/azurin family copper-binding protein [Halorussus amylolyticus]|uniref:plastocyanin/azurin family copper-binding protein n=1 Tax=Halorussus amylolyticus TaxID=1126242 RepID=UPI00104BD3CB|nr:plastocyanin/azurin family copper-binding protein [Halorussus amylolyticus]